MIIRHYDHFVKRLNATHMNIRGVGLIGLASSADRE